VSSLGRVPHLDAEAVGCVRDDLTAASYTVDDVQDGLGPVGAAALSRNETTPGIRATTGGSALETLVRLWPLQAAVPVAAAQAALPTSLDVLVAGGLLDHEGGQVRAVVDLRPYGDDVGDWWVCSDLTPGLDGVLSPVPADHVLGVSSASSTLAQITVRPEVARALDLGTGCGVQSLHLARHARHVVATDVSDRAVAMAGITAALNRVTVDLRHGDLYEPVADDRFDLVVSNPPFVVSPGGRHVYRDSGLVGDEISLRVVVEGARRLTEGGWLQALVNWVRPYGRDWRDRMGAWVAATGCDAWVVEREVLDPAAYVELWLRDSGEVALPDYKERYDRWLGWFAEQGVEGVGFGWVTLRCAGADDPAVRLEEWPHPVEQPLGPTVQAALERAAILRGWADDAALLERRLAVAPDVVQEQVGPPGAEDPETVVLRQRRGVMRARQVGTAEAGLVGACDGSVPLGVLVDAVAEVLGRDPEALRAELAPRVRELVAEGFLLPA
jgi:methylase of polypeptide subunit release factors